jgi:hypothetical protein
MIKKLRAQDGAQSKVLEEFVRMVKDVMGGVYAVGKEGGDRGDEMDVDADAVLEGGVTAGERTREVGRVMVEEVGE